MRTINDVDVENKVVGVRVDLNTPIENGKIVDDTRIKSILPTIKELLSKKANIYLFSHLGQPKDSEQTLSLQPIRDRLQELLEMEINFEKTLYEEKKNAKGITLFENIRFIKGETENDKEVAKKIANIIDIFVMDAFATAHRKHASTYGVFDFVEDAVAGPLLLHEIKNLEKIFEKKGKTTAIIAGAKVSSKLGVLENLFEKVDNIILGGGIANTFLAACDKSIGSSLYEPKLIEKAKYFLEKYEDKILLPIDAVVAECINSPGNLQIIHNIDGAIFDVGPSTIESIKEILLNSDTIIWSGTLGVYEKEEFSKGTKELSEILKGLKAFIAAGGGDTVAAINKFKCHNNIQYISTGGSAFLNFLEGKSLPAIEKLSQFK